MPAVTKVLVVGGGLAGAATAILLARDGVAVDLVELKPDVSAIGSGITLQGNALRELRRLGVWPRAEAAGYPFDCLGLRAPDGTVLARIPDVRSGGAGLPASIRTAPASRSRSPRGRPAGTTSSSAPTASARRSAG
jgi:2-polyprenyl-6-methoxyphenol hydroxylase-like FAD-dependent oxidoreductase